MVKPFKITYQITPFINETIEKHMEGYADDITLCLENSMVTLKDIINILENFGNISGLRINAKINSGNDIWPQQPHKKPQKTHWDLNG